MTLEVKGKPTKIVPAVTTIELPLYRQHDCGGDDFDSVYYTKIESTGETRLDVRAGGQVPVLRAVSINVRHSYRDSEVTYELSVDSSYKFDERSELDYNAGRGEYGLTREDYEKQVAKFKEQVLRYL